MDVNGCVESQNDDGKDHYDYAATADDDDGLVGRNFHT